MDALSGSGGPGGFWQWTHRHPFGDKKSSNRRNRNSKPSDSVEITRNAVAGYRVPFGQAVIAGSLVLAGDTIAQFNERWRNRNNSTKDPLNASDYNETEDMIQVLLSNHDWLRALRMTSYGYLLYGPGSYAWYQFLDRTLPKQTVQNLMLKVLLNQIVLGPCVIAVVFAWNNLWQGKLSELPKKYQKDALPTLLYGFRFWIPVSLLNFWVIPLQARVAFMSSGSIFWNFCLSSTMNK